MTKKKKAVETVSETTRAAENRFSKEQLLMSERFRDRRDIADALLDDGVLYTVRDVEQKVENYMKGKVK
ncbi:hypothetical protein IMSAGC011_02334 [Lachnospiraceae bacterium]|nr:hypothetical protein IMSAGC011_02334 [Lachnospiraceae bacterium]